MTDKNQKHKVRDKIICMEFPGGFMVINLDADPSCVYSLA